MSQWARVASILAALHDSGRADQDNVAVRLVTATRDGLPVTGAGMSWVTPDGPGEPAENALYRPSDSTSCRFTSRGASL